MKYNLSWQVLLTTCVGSKEELEVLVVAATQHYRKHYQPAGTKLCPAWNRDSLHTLYYFMRSVVVGCSCGYYCSCVVYR